MGSSPGIALTWYTDRTDLQAAELGSGTGPTLRLFGDDCFGVTHTVRLEGLDSDGNPAAPRTVPIFIYTLCRATAGRIRSTPADGEVAAGLSSPSAGQQQRTA